MSGNGSTSILGLDNAFSQLVAWKLLAPADAVQGGLKISSVSRRNFALLVERSAAPDFFVKQPGPDEASRRALETEHRFSSFCHQEPAAVGVARRLPRILAWRPREAALVLERLQGERLRWGDRKGRRTRGTAPAPHRLLGRALGGLHRTFRDTTLSSDPRLGSLPTKPPGSLATFRPTPAALRRMSPARLELLRVLQADSRSTTRLEEARTLWRSETLIHADIRADNIFVLPAGPSVGERIRLVDWETVRHGDPAWDVASVIRDALLIWVLNMDLASDLPLEERPATARYSLEALQPDVEGFWRGYLESAALGRQASDSLLRRAVHYCGVRLIDTAWERSRWAAQLLPLVQLLLRTSAEALSEPEWVLQRLVGARPGAQPA